MIQRPFHHPKSPQFHRFTPALRIPVMADQCANLDARFTGEMGIIRRENDIHSSLRKGKKKRHIGRFGTMFNHF
jgi:hypothetical protein